MDIRKQGKFYQGDGSKQKVTQEIPVEDRKVGSKKKDFFTDVTYDSLRIDALTKKAIKQVCKYEFLTKV
jgi:hypothetical protein